MEAIAIFKSEFHRRLAVKKAENAAKCDFWRDFWCALERYENVSTWNSFVILFFRLAVISIFLAAICFGLIYLSLFFTAITILWQ